jgi:hypothetical protein
VRQRRPVRIGAAEEVHVQDTSQLLGLELLDLGVDRHHHGDDEGVDPPEALDRSGAQEFGVGLARRLARDHQALAARSLDLGGGVLERLRVASG